ncbi:alpha-galactosidase A precursor [Penicillium malachiteum]|nr:alpha-galactosidase A precursor [Penicillium malachiteum]
MNRQPKIELLQAEVDCGDDQSFFRLIDDQSIKYLTIDPGIYSPEHMCFGPSLASLLPGDWNDGLVSKNIYGEPYFASFKMTQFPGVQSIWHNTSIDYSELLIGEKLRTDIYEMECARFPNRTIVATWASSLASLGQSSICRMRPRCTTGYPA